VTVTTSSLEATPSASALARFSESFATTWNLLSAITMRDIRVRYQGTFLSFIWWVARPLALGLVLYFALGRVLRLDIPNYSIFLISALFPWFWFSGSVSGATGSFVGNAGLLKKVRFPKLVLPLSSVFFNTVQFFVTIPILVGLVLAAGIDPEPMWLVGVPALVALQLLFICGLGILLATLNVFLRDLGPTVEVVLLLLFYVSAIIFPLDYVPSEFEPLMALNPVAPLIDAWRNLFLYGEFIDGAIWPTLVATALGVVLAFAAFTKLERYFADAL